MKGRFSPAPPLQRLDNLGGGDEKMLPECNVILGAAQHVSVEQVLVWLRGANDDVRAWFEQCNEPFVQRKKAKLSWDEFAAQDAGQAVLSYAQYKQ
jgi:hypothetical protein